MKKNLKHQLFQIGIVLLLLIPFAIPYFHKGYFPTHDGEWAVVRLADMYREIRDHQFPPRYSGNLNFGYGYPLFNFAYPGPYYLGLIFVFLKFGFVGSIKLLFFLSVLFSEVCMYIFASRLWKNTWAGIVSATLYLYLPYRMVDLFVRGSLGESIAFGLFPLIFLCIYEIYRRNHRPFYIAVGSISYAFVVLSHNIMATFFTPLLFTFIISLIIFKKEKDVLQYIIMIAFGLLLSCFFWFPALSEKHNILLSKIPIADRSLYFVKPLQLILPTWGYGTPTETNPFTYQIGTAHIAAFLLVFIILILEIIKKMKRAEESATLIILVLTVLAMIALLFSPTLIIWKSMPLLSEINYPWTLLGPIGFIISILAGYLVTQKKPIRAIAFSLALLSIVMTISYAHPRIYTDYGDNYYVNNDATTTSSSELMPLWVKTFPLNRASEKILLLGEKGTISDASYNSKYIAFTANVLSPAIVRINTMYYPGWHIYVDEKEVIPTYNNVYGVMDIPIAIGKHKVIGKFTETPGRLAADIISAVSFVALLGYLSFAKKLYHEKA